MSKIVVVILASIIGAVIGYGGVQYFSIDQYFNKIIEVEPVMELDELDKLEEQLKNEEIIEEIRGWWNESDVWRRIHLRNRKRWTQETSAA